VRSCGVGRQAQSSKLRVPLQAACCLGGGVFVLYYTPPKGHIGASVDSTRLAPQLAQGDFVSLVRRAWDRELEFTQLLDAANEIAGGGDSSLAAVLYQTWLARNQTPLNHFVHFNLGAALFNAGDLEAARLAYLRAIELAPDFVQPHFNLGLVGEKLACPDVAIAEWTWVIEHASNDEPEQRAMRLSAFNNLGRLQETLRQYDAALVNLTRSLELDPRQADVLHHWVFLRARMCEWPVYAPVVGVDEKMMRDSTSALAMIALSDDPQRQLSAAVRFVREKVRTDVPALARDKRYGHQRLRVAYLSSDFCLHPIALLTAQLLELHDRSRFEVYAYCWTREDGSDLRKRIVAATDQFVRIDALTDEQAAARILADEIDVLVDLHGQTLGARPNILAYRPAPIQVTYLGLPATTGMPFIDYVIADRFLIPQSAVGYYTETPLYMPDVYQVSDRKRACAKVPSRGECGLPPEGFVFCSFNNNYKFTPEVFAVWMNILRRVPNSVLWLLADNPWAQANLCRNALAQGIDTARLLFAPRLAPDEYLARFGAADLFLDSYPFNAGTTANDALWMGLPVLTCSGQTFASRMAGALLTAARLDELITYNLADYEEAAVALAGSPERCRQLRDHLREVRQGGALFDTPRFVRNLESHLEALVARLPAGQG